IPPSLSSLAQETYTTPVSTDTPNNTMKPMPDDTENAVPVTHIANTAPIGADSNTPTTVIMGNLKLPYSTNNSPKITTTVSGRITRICAREAVYSLYSPPHSSR